MIFKPLNGHIQIQPMKHDSFVASDKDSYEEIGTVLSIADNVTVVNVGDEVFFDSYLCAKYPNGTDGEFYWLVPAENLRAKRYA